NQIICILENNKESNNERNNYIDPGIYDSNKLVTEIQKILPELIITIENKRVEIKSNSEKNFDVLNNEKSCFRHLGFMKNNYIGKNRYIAEQYPAIDTNPSIALFIEGISDIKPLLVYNSLGSLKSQLPFEIKFSEPIKILG